MLLGTLDPLQRFQQSPVEFVTVVAESMACGFDDPHLLMMQIESAGDMEQQGHAQCGNRYISGQFFAARQVAPDLQKGNPGDEHQGAAPLGHLQRQPDSQCPHRLF